MKRAFLSHIAFLLLINLLIKPFYIFGIDRTVQNTVGPDAYGIFFTLLNLSYILTIINDLGIQNFNNRNISQNSQLITKHLSHILGIKILLAALYITLIAIAGYLLGYAEKYPLLLLLVACTQILDSLIFYIRSNIAGLGWYRKDSIMSVLDKIFMIFLCGYLLWFTPDEFEFSVYWFVMAQLISFSLTAIIGLGILKKELSHWTLRFKPLFMLAILKKSIPFALVVFLMFIFTKIDGIMIEQMLIDGEYQAGVYASSYRLLDASNMIGYLFAALLLPMFARMLKAKESVLDLVKTAQSMLWAGSVSLAIILFYFQEEIILLLYTHALPTWAPVLGFLMFSFIARSSSYVFGTLLTANGNLKKMNILYCLCILLNIILNYILIQKLKSEGAAIATLISQSIAAIGLIYLSKKELGVSTGMVYWARLILFAFLLAISCYAIGSITLSWGYKFIFCILAASALTFIFKLVDIGTMVKWVVKKVE